MSNRITIGISTYNDTQHLPLLLQSIRWYTHVEEPYDVIVCDDGSRDEEKQKTREICAHFGAALIEHSSNLGIPATWNHLTLANPDAEIVVLLNNDLLVLPHWLRVAVHFLDANKNNPSVGSMFWNPVNRTNLEMMRAMLPQLGHTVTVSYDVVTGQELGSHTPCSLWKARIGEGHGLGRVMCPCGCCFAFRMDVFKHVGPFDERLTSFHEESDWGTRCAYHGRAAFGFSYPRPYHAHGYTFGVNPELHASERMRASRRLYRQIWEVPENIEDYFQYVNERLMPRVPQTQLKYLSPDYDIDPEEWTLPGGEVVHLPALVEKEGEF